MSWFKLNESFMPNTEGGYQVVIRNIHSIKSKALKGNIESNGEGELPVILIRT